MTAGTLPNAAELTRQFLGLVPYSCRPAPSMGVVRDVYQAITRLGWNTTGLAAACCENVPAGASRQRSRIVEHRLHRIAEMGLQPKARA